LRVEVRSSREKVRLICSKGLLRVERVRTAVNELGIGEREAMSVSESPREKELVTVLGEDAKD
jgi:hypothetical protein